MGLIYIKKMARVVYSIPNPANPEKDMIQGRNGYIRNGYSFVFKNYTYLQPILI